MFVSLAGKAQTRINPAQQQDWADIARLPDWSGTWTPDIKDQDAQRDSPPWNARAGKIIADMIAAELSGRPAGIFNNCLPEGMPTWMLITHNAFEFLFTPGRVTMLGESDGQLRRIYTDGRTHPRIRRPSMVIQSAAGRGYARDRHRQDSSRGFLAVTEGAGIPIGENVHIVERMHLAAGISRRLEITAPHVLASTWKTTRIYYRRRDRAFGSLRSLLTG
jgi:hypothetical protein